MVFACIHSSNPPFFAGTCIGYLFLRGHIFELNSKLECIPDSTYELCRMFLDRFQLGIKRGEVLKELIVGILNPGRKYHLSTIGHQFFSTPTLEWFQSVPWLFGG